ncbi:hypothetical protein FRC09_014632 [Ceratobasidium sp. 395]|nr:hypothetical protein FRC09_014632 [Ceratobasidium sp. 395]
MELWLERAGEAPLNFHFQRGRSADADVLVDPQLYDILRPHISRAVSLTFSHVTDVHVKTLINLYAACCLPGQLRVLSMTGTIFSLSSHEFVWPIGTLRDLTVLELNSLSPYACPTWDEFSSMLSNSPGLHTLRVIDDHPYYRNQDLDPPEIRLPNLKYVEIAPICQFSGNVRLVRALMAGDRALHVQVRLPTHCDEDSLSALAAFLRRSNVVYLYFLEPSFSRLSPSSFEVFESVPQLKFLSFHCAGDYDPLTALLRTADGKNPHTKCTSLRILHLQHVVMDRSVWGRIQELIETHQLEKIIIGPQAKGFDNIVEPGQVTRLDWLRERVSQVVYSDQVQFPVSEDPR